MRSFVSLCAIALLTVSSAVMAQSTPAAPGTNAAPAATVSPAGDATRISPEARARFEAFRTVCGADLKSYCGDIQRGTDEGRTAMRQCVEANKAKFTTTCQAALVERDAARETRKQGQAAPASEKPKT